MDALDCHYSNFDATRPISAKKVDLEKKRNWKYDWFLTTGSWNFLIQSGKLIITATLWNPWSREVEMMLEGRISSIVEERCVWRKNAFDELSTFHSKNCLKVVQSYTFLELFVARQAHLKTSHLYKYLLESERA